MDFKYNDEITEEAIDSKKIKQTIKYCHLIRFEGIGLSIYIALKIFVDAKLVRLTLYANFILLILLLIREKFYGFLKLYIQEIISNFMRQKLFKILTLIVL